jgi:hypothetical protein
MGADAVPTFCPLCVSRCGARAEVPQVVFAQHGWWQACDELGLPGYPPYGPDSANLNLVLRQTPSDPISGSSPLRASVCDVSLLSGTTAKT